MFTQIKKLEHRFLGTFLINSFFKLIKFKKKKNLIQIGSQRCNYILENRESIYNSAIISAGVGLDISFDIEMINRFGLKVILVDPTPVSVEHYSKIINASGASKTKEYTLMASREIEEYDLKNVTSKNLLLINKALYNKEKVVRFYLSPKKINPLNDNFSHSINNWQSFYNKKKPFIEVKTIKISTIMKQFNILSLPILKLDIEGAEHEVIDDLIKSNIFPSQILVDLDELGIITIHSYRKLVSTYNKLTKNNYDAIDTGDKRNFLFSRSE